MRSYRLFSYGFPLLLLLVLNSCETDFDTTAEYEDITVVYGLLDQKQPDQYIKINKAFLSETDVLLYANMQDSNEYLVNTLDVKLQEWDEGQLLKTYSFDTTTIYNKESGQYYSPEQIIYKWNRPQFPVSIEYVVLGANDTIEAIPIWLDDSHEYRLKILNTITGKEITASTYLVDAFKITSPAFSTTINFSPTPSAQRIFKWDEANNAGKYDYELRFNYFELSFGSQDTIAKYITLTKGSKNATGNGELTFGYWDDSFYASCQNLIPHTDGTEDQISQRFSGIVEIIISAAAEEFSLYLQVNEPSTSIIQEKPLYSNVDNGIGIFSARYRIAKPQDLNGQTVSELKKIEALKFEF